MNLKNSLLTRITQIAGQCGGRREHLSLALSNYTHKNQAYH